MAIMISIISLQPYRVFMIVILAIVQLNAHLAQLPIKDK